MHRARGLGGLKCIALNQALRPDFGKLACPLAGCDRPGGKPFVRASGAQTPNKKIEKLKHQHLGMGDDMTRSNFRARRFATAAATASLAVMLSMSVSHTAMAACSFSPGP